VHAVHLTFLNDYVAILVFLLAARRPLYYFFYVFGQTGIGNDAFKNLMLLLLVLLVRVGTVGVQAVGSFGGVVPVFSLVSAGDVGEVAVGVFGFFDAVTMVAGMKSVVV